MSIPAGSLAVFGAVGVRFIHPTTGVVLDGRPFEPVSQIAVLPSGVWAYVRSGGAGLRVMAADFTVIADIVPIGVSGQFVTASATHFYFCEPLNAAGGKVRKISSTGAVVQTWIEGALLPGFGQNPAVSANGSTLYYAEYQAVFVPPLHAKSYNLNTSTIIGNFVTGGVYGGGGDQTPNPIFVLGNGDVVIVQQGAVVLEELEIQRYSAAGALLRADTAGAGQYFPQGPNCTDASDTSRYWTVSGDSGTFSPSHIQGLGAAGLVSTVAYPLADFGAMFAIRVDVPSTPNQLAVFNLVTDEPACVIKTFATGIAWPQWLSDCSVQVLGVPGSDPYLVDADVVRLALTGFVQSTLAYAHATFDSGLVGVAASVAGNRLWLVGRWNRPLGTVINDTPGVLVYDLQARTLVARPSTDGVVPLVYQDPDSMAAASCAAYEVIACSACGPGTGGGGLPTVNVESLWSIIGLTFGYQVLPGLKRDDPEV